MRDYISYDEGESFRKAFEYPSSMDSKRLQIRYAEDGGIQKDGVIELRRGVDDLSLGDAHYAQVRILVDGTHYLKGMAVYSDDLPDGVDVVFNTNKKKGTPTQDVLKKIKDDPDNPFGSAIKELSLIHISVPVKVKSKMVCPVRQKDGTWTTVIKEFEEDIPDLGREELICNKCGRPDYPKCKETVCKAWMYHKAKKRAED